MHKFVKNYFIFKTIYMKISNAAVLLMTGIAIGAVAGLLMAPDEGTKTRKKWLKKAKKYKKNIEDKASEYKDKAGDLKDNIEGAADDLKKRFS
jgi:gas vesicle protein